VQRFLSNFWVPLFGAALLAALAIPATDPRVAGLLANTGLLALAAAAIAVPLGALLAVAIAKTNLAGRRLAMGLLAAMLFVPLYIHAAAWDAGFGMQGWYTLRTNPQLIREPLLVGWRAAIWIHAMAGVPWVALIVAAGLRAVEPELEEDAALDASAMRVLWQVSLRRAIPAVIVAALWVTITCAAEISVTDLYQVRTFAEEIYTQSALGTLGPPPVGLATTVTEPIHITAAGMWLGLACSLLLAVAATGAARTFSPNVFEPPARPPWIARLRRGRIPVAIATWACLGLLVGLPLANLVTKAGIDVTVTDSARTRSWSAAKATGLVVAAPVDHHRELGQSAKIGAAAATAAVVLGTGLAWSLRGTRRVPWLRLVGIGLCLTVPGPLLGVGLIRLLNQPPDSPLAWLAPLYDSLFAPWLAQTVRALPIATLLLWPALSAVPQATLDSAASEGAGRWRRLLLVALPQCRGAMAAAWLIALAVAVGELAATVLVIPPGTTTIAVRIFSLLHYGVEDRVASLCLVMIGAVAVATLGALGLARRVER
jgi:iron(III) transport system permease protein